MRILLVGPPNVGKSALFNRLTGLNVDVANYPGTTVEYKKGFAQVDGIKYELIDVPGTYTLESVNEAEKIALEMLSSSPNGVICVLDAKNLENSIYLLLKVIEKNLPTIAVINRVDLIDGTIDKLGLSEELEIHIIETVAIEGKGIPELKQKIKELLNDEITPSKKKYNANWKNAEEIEKIASKNINTKNENWRDKWGNLLVKPLPGIPLAILVMVLTFSFVVGVGLALRRFILLPLLMNLIFPQIIRIVEMFIVNQTLLNILIGEYGFLIKSIEWPIGLVMPYIFSFYTALSILEDSGYLPRLAVLVDGIFKKMKLSGSHIIPIMLGYGCAVPAIMSTRTIDHKKSRIIVSSMICLGVPCIAQSGAFIALLAEHSITLVASLLIFSLFIVFISGIIMGKLLKPIRTPTIQEVPDLLIPDFKILGKKIWIRLKNALYNEVFAMVLIIGVASVLYETGVLIYIGKALEPLVIGWLGLPSEASTPLILGIFRRELTVLPLLDMDLTTLQLFVAAIIALLYVPCVAVLGILGKEFGSRISLIILFMTITISFLIGGIVSQIGMIFL